MRIHSSFLSTVCRSYCRSYCRSDCRSYHRDTVMMSNKKHIVSIPGAIRNIIQVNLRYLPRGPKQTEYVDLLDEDGVNMLVSIGPTGTGKTLFAILSAITELQKGAVQKIVFTTPYMDAFSIDHVSYLPANLRINPMLRYIFDILDDCYSVREIDKMLYEGVIEIIPMQLVIGRTFKDSFIVADEMQFSTVDQLFTLTTRLGERSRIVIMGDITDCLEDDDNGLVDIVNKIERNGPSDSIRLLKMGRRDVQRSAVVSKVLALYDKKNIHVSSSFKPRHGEYSVFSLRKQE